MTSSFWVELEKLIVKFIWKSPEPNKAQSSDLTFTFILVISVVQEGDGRGVCHRDVNINMQRIFQTCFSNQNQSPSPKHHQNIVKAVHTIQYTVFEF